MRISKSRAEMRPPMHLSLRFLLRRLKAKLHHSEPPEKRRVPREVQLLVGDLRALLREYNVERRGQDRSPEVWTPEKLRALLHEQLSGDEVLVVSNREPSVHVTTPHGIEVRRPASGLVTAVGPVMRACSGTWIAHGGCSADRTVVDRHDRVQVPPEHPSNTLRRVWLSEAED